MRKGFAVAETNSRPMISSQGFWLRVIVLLWSNPSDLGVSSVLLAPSRAIVLRALPHHLPAQSTMMNLASLAEDMVVVSQLLTSETESSFTRTKWKINYSYIQITVKRITDPYGIRKRPKLHLVSYQVAIRAWMRFVSSHFQFFL